MFLSSDAYSYNQNHQSRIHINEHIQNLKTSIDNLTQLIVHHQNPVSSTLSSHRSTSFLDKFRRLFTLFQSSPKPNTNQLNEECYQILQRHHLTKENLVNIYQLFDRNETIFLNWLRTIMPESFLLVLLNYVKYFDSI